MADGDALALYGQPMELSQGQALGLLALAGVAVGAVLWLVLKDGDGDCLIRPGTVIAKFGAPGSLYVVGSDCELHSASGIPAAFKGAPVVTVVDTVISAVGIGAPVPAAGPYPGVNWNGPTQLPGITEAADPGNAPGGERVGAATTVSALAEEYWGDPTLASALAVANLALVGSTSGGFEVPAGTWFRVPSKKLAERLTANLAAAAESGTGILAL